MLRLPLHRWLAVIASLAFVAGAQAQFVSFFDHARGTGTHQLTLSFSLQTSAASGYFTNLDNGMALPVTLTSTLSNNITPPAAVSFGSAAGMPAAGTPAYNTFDTFVDFIGSPQAAVQVPSNCFVVLTFSNLNPSLRYSFKGSAVRGSIATPSYSNRWTKVTILDVESATAYHTSNALTSLHAPADLAANEAALLFGQNHLPNQGDMAGWEDIGPGTDGMFKVVCTKYTGFVPNGTSRDVVGVTSPYGYAITGIRLEEMTPEPVMIISGPTPSSLEVEQRQTAEFTVTASGTGPRYEWFRPDGQPITGALNTNTATLTFTNAQPANSGTYRVRVSNSLSSLTSDPVTLTVNSDATPPSLVSALGLVDGTNIVLGFSEPLSTSPSLSPDAFHVHLTAGGGVLSVVSATITNATNVLIVTSAKRSSNVNYTVAVDANAVRDLNAVPFSGGERPLVVQIYLLSFTGTSWKYNAQGEDLAFDWYLPDTEYDDSAWSNGLSVFDGKTPQPPGRTTIAGFPVATQLPLTNSLHPTTDGVIPTYYFRTHFNVATTVEHILSLKLRTLVDDFDDFFINTQEARANPGYPSTNPPPRFGYSGGTAVNNASVQGPFDISPEILSAGDNIAAAIVNQHSGSSSDVTFAYELIATIDRFTEAGVALSIAPDPNVPGNILITWPDPAAVLYSRTTLDSGTWMSINTSATPGQYSFSPNSAVQKFFTLRQEP
jgi:hypothetical protein